MDGPVDCHAYRDDIKQEEPCHSPEDPVRIGGKADHAVKHIAAESIRPHKPKGQAAKKHGKSCLDEGGGHRKQKEQQKTFQAEAEDHKDKQPVQKIPDGGGVGI